MSIRKNPRSEQRWRDIIKDCQESGVIDPVLLPTAWNIRRGISLLA